MKNALALLAGSLLLPVLAVDGSFLGAAEAPDRAILFPRLAPGESVTYEIGYRASTKTDTESNVTAPMAPTGGQTEAHLFLQVEVVGLGSDAGKPIAHLLTRLVSPEAATGAGPADSANSNSQPAKTVEFTLHGNGQVSDLKGLEQLTRDESAAWQEWVARFGVGAALPEKGVRPGEKWRVEEPITNALLTGLSWEKESQFVDEEPCAASPGPQQTAAAPAASTNVAESCAVILTTATLKQRNPQKDATPEDYRLHDLRTYGVAKGRNEIVSYISLKTGLVVRATEEANQSLNVIVAKTDGSNRVHYVIDAQSHAQVLLKSAPALAQR